MPVNFAKQKVAPKAAPEATKPAAAEAKPTNGKVPWYKRGAAGAAEVDKYEKEMQEKWDEGNKMYRYWMNEGENARVTFIDGNLDAEGHLDSIIFREHRFRGGEGKPPIFRTCTAELEPCPMCEDGNDAYIVAALTVIDHRQFTTSKNKTYQYQRRLYMATKNTFKKLQHYATQHDGLAGCTFDIARIGENSPRVGSDFTFVQKDSIEDLQETFMEEVTDPKTKKTTTQTKFVPADYDKEIGYVEASVLREKYGYGSKVIGSESKAKSMPQKTKVNFADKV